MSRLTSRVLARAGWPFSILEEANGHAAGHNGDLRLDWEDTVAIKQRLLDNWSQMSSEEIIERLDHIWTTQETGVPKVDLRQTPELWLLKALAQEKCLYVDLGEIEQTYRHCRHLGRWNAVLVRNNLGVLRARRQECLDALNLLAEAVELAALHRVPLKAPFYNAALVFWHLYQRGLIFDPRYLDVLSRAARAVSPGGNGAPAGTADAPPAEAAAVTMGEDETKSAIADLAGYGYGIEEPASQDVLSAGAAYLVPEIDLFESFGDFPDKVDTRTAHEFFEKGNVFADRDMFADGIRSLELAGSLDPARADEIAARVEQLSDQWRFRENRRMENSVARGDFDEASRIILNLDERLRRSDDAQTVSTIRRLKHLKLLRDANKAAEVKGREAEAWSLYVELLKDADLEESLRLDVSGRLAKPLRDLADDEERHQGLRELALYGAHPEIIKRLADELETRLVKEAARLTQLKQYEPALMKYLWALLLPERGARREELMRPAMFLYALPARYADPDSNAALANPAFAELRIELRERWQNRQSEAAVAKFRKLDNEPWLRRKRIAELVTLLEDLIKHEPTTERLVAKLRLPREEKAQRFFQQIIQEFETVSQEKDHSARREAIFEHLRGLREMAIDFAAGGYDSYSKQITDFVLQAEEFLLRADNRKFQHELAVEANRQHGQALEQFRSSLRTSNDPALILTMICETLHTARRTILFTPVAELSVYWFRHTAIPLYQGLAIREPQRAREVIADSLSTVQHNRAVLPEEFGGEFAPFLEALAEELPPPTEPEPLAEPEPPPPPPPPHGFFAWLKSKFQKKVEG